MVIRIDDRLQDDDECESCETKENLGGFFLLSWATREDPEEYEILCEDCAKAKSKAWENV